MLWSGWRRLAAAAMIFGSLGLGCKSWDLDGEKFSEDNLSQTVRRARPQKEEKDIDYWSFSNKGRQIERDLQVQ